MNVLLGHELTHVVQQGQGRVSPTKQAKGMAINDSPALENEADGLGKQAAQGKSVDVSGKGNGVQKKGGIRDLQYYIDMGGQLDTFIMSRFDHIQTKKYELADTWGRNADKEDFKPGKFFLEIALGVLCAGIGGAIGGIVKGAITHAVSELATLAITDASKQLSKAIVNNIGVKAMSILTSQSDSFSDNAQNGLDTSSATGLKDYFVEASKNMFLYDRDEQEHAFATNGSSLSHVEMVALALMLDRSNEKIAVSNDEVMQQLTIGFIRLQESIHLSKDSTKSGKYEVTSGQIGFLGGVGKYNSAKPMLKEGKYSILSESTANELQNMQIKDLPLSIAFNFKAETDKWSGKPTNVAFVISSNGTIYASKYKGMWDEVRFLEGRKWLACYYLNKEKPTESEISKYAIEGVKKLYNEKVKMLTVPKLENVDFW